MDEDESPSSSPLNSLHSIPATSEFIMPPKKKARPWHDEFIPLYLLNISRQLTRPLPSVDSEEWHSLAADMEIAIDREDFTQSLPLFPASLHPELNDLKEAFESREASADPSLNPYKNLQQYATKARLPPMPWSPDLGEGTDPPTLPGDDGDGLQRRTATHTIGSSTVVYPDSARKLRSVRKIPNSQLFQRVLAYSKAHLPSSQCVDISTNKPILSDPPKSVDIGISVPHHEHKVSESGRPAPNSEPQVQVNWVMNIVCKTSQRILHVYDNTCKDWQYRIVRGKESQRMLADYVWSRSAGNGGARLAIEVKTPCTTLLNFGSKGVE
ncbi:hypothetical protein FRC01_005811 [Tulasnella sp. 417]|nr:hypothetical protein FRC01_005811 [Tulasnella sp. 417]